MYRTVPWDHALHSRRLCQVRHCPVSEHRFSDEEAAQQARAADRLRRGYARRVLPESAAAEARAVRRLNVAPQGEMNHGI